MTENTEGPRSHIVISQHEVEQLYSDKTGLYLRFIRTFAYPQGLRSYFRKTTLLRPVMHVLDAGCGTGVVTMALLDALRDRGISPGEIKGFDITPAMLDAFRDNLDARATDQVEILQGDVLELDELPDGWSGFDLIVSSAMMEYLPSERIGDALSGLRSLLKPHGKIILFITRDNWLTRLLIGRWWKANCYSQAELGNYFSRAGYSSVNFSVFPHPYRHLSLWGHIVEAGN